MSLEGFPHSDIPGSKLVCSSPGLIAAYRVLHRLLAPRHSPYALSSLTTSVWTHADWFLAFTSRPIRMRPLFSHCVPMNVAVPGEVCSKRTTVCRIFSGQRPPRLRRSVYRNALTAFLTAASARQGSHCSEPNLLS